MKDSLVCCLLASLIHVLPNTHQNWSRFEILKAHIIVACERRRVSGCRLVPPKGDVCEPEPENDFCDIGILSQSQFSSNNPRTTARGMRCEEHSSFILSWNLIGQGGTKVITSQKSFPGSGSRRLFFGGAGWRPEVRLRLQVNIIAALLPFHLFIYYLRKSRSWLCRWINTAC